MRVKGKIVRGEGLGLAMCDPALLVINTVLFMESGQSLVLSLLQRLTSSTAPFSYERKTMGPS